MIRCIGEVPLEDSDLRGPRSVLASRQAVDALRDVVVVYAASFDEVSDGLRLLASSQHDAPVILRFALRTVSMSRVIRAFPQVRFMLFAPIPGFEVHDLIAMSAASYQVLNPCDIYARARGRLGDQQLDLLLSLFVLCDRPRTQEEVACALGMSRATLQRRFYALRQQLPSVPAFCQLVARFHALHLSNKMSAASAVDEAHARKCHPLVATKRYLRRHLSNGSLADLLRGDRNALLSSNFEWLSA